MQLQTYILHLWLQKSASPISVIWSHTLPLYNVKLQPLLKHATRVMFTPDALFPFLQLERSRSNHGGSSLTTGLAAILNAV